MNYFIIVILQKESPPRDSRIYISFTQRKTKTIAISNNPEFTARQIYVESFQRVHDRKTLQLETMVFRLRGCLFVDSRTRSGAMYHRPAFGAEYYRIRWYLRRSGVPSLLAASI